jgi:large subunit ribosomal protein L28
VVYGCGYRSKRFSRFATWNRKLSVVRCPVFWRYRFAWTRRDPMAEHCHFCGKTPMTGKNVSHAHNVTSRKWHLNLQSVRALIAPGTTRRVRACSRCLRSGKVVKPAVRVRATSPTS